MLRSPVEQAIARRERRLLAVTTARAAAARLLVSGLVLWVLFTQVFGLLRVQGNSMRPTAGDGDLVLMSRRSRVVSDDLVVYRTGNKLSLGRVVAQPGDVVEVTRSGDVKVNGNVQASVTQGSTPQGSLSGRYPVTLGDGEYFVLNDAREDTSDSREFGPIGTDGVEGRATALLRLRGI